MHKDKSPIISTLELISILLVSVSFLIVVNIDIFIHYFSNKDTDSLNYFNERLSTFLLGPIDVISERMLTPNITTFILWALLGVVCYTIVYFFIDFGGEISDSVKLSDKFIHPQEHKKSIYKILLLANMLLLLATVTLCIFIVFTIFKYLIPYASSNILLALYESQNPLQTLQYIFLAFIAITIIPVSILVLLRTYHFIRQKISI